MLARATRIGALALMLQGCALLGGGQTPQIESPATTDAPSEAIVIQIGNMTVDPSVARVKQGGLVAWTSVSTDFRGTLSFPESVVSQFTCKDLRPDFYVADGRLQSIAIASGQENVVLPCPLRPGTYRYQINLTSGGEGVGGRSMGANPQLTLDATLTVE
jgi:hypothetical protein